MAVGILYFSHNSFVKILEPSSCEATLLGPKTLILFFFKKSTNPSTKGFSGPTIIKSILFLITVFFISSKLFRSIDKFSAIRLVPAFPGIQKILVTFFEVYKKWLNACSLPPLPIIPIFI